MNEKTEILVDVKSATQVEAYLPMTPLPKSWKGQAVKVSLAGAPDAEIARLLRIEQAAMDVFCWGCESDNGPDSVEAMARLGEALSAP